MRGESLAEVVVEAAGAEESAHRAAAHEHDPLGFGVAVPPARQQPLHRADLDVTEVVRQPSFLRGERADRVERWAGGGLRDRDVAHVRELISALVRARSA